MMDSDDMEISKQSLATKWWTGSARHYLTAIGVVALMALARWVLRDWFDQRATFMPFFVAVFIAGWLGGFATGMLATSLSVLVVLTWFSPQLNWLALRPTEIGSVILFVGCGLLISMICESLHRARRACEQQVNERQAAQQALQRQRDWFAGTFASIGDGLIVTDNDDRVQLINRVAEAHTGWTQQQADGQALAQVFRIVQHPAPSFSAQSMQSIADQGQADLRRSLSSRTMLIHRDGSERPISHSVAPIVDQRGQPTGKVVVFRDISEQMRAQQLLLRSERDLADFFDNAVVGMHSLAADGTVLRVNRAELAMLGYQEGEFLGRNLAEFFVDPQVFPAIVQAIKEQSFVQNYEAVLRAKDGSHKHVLIDSNALWADEQLLHTRCFVRDITERKQAEQEIARLLDDLRLADRRKDEFLALLAHELRNPLAPMRTALEVIQRHGQDHHRMAQSQAMLHRQLTHMVRLIDDLLDASRITANRLELQLAFVQLKPILKLAEEISAPVLDAAGHRFIVSIPEQPIWLYADANRLSQVFANLLNNASKFTDRGGQIELLVDLLDEEVLIRVRDNGIGIAPEMLSSIFEMFIQVDRRIERSRGGLGLGLTLVQRLVELHGGHVDARSDGLNRGSEFAVYLPLAPAEALRQHQPDELTDRSVHHEISGRSASIRLLVVDDNVDAADSLAMFFSLADYTVRIAYDGVAALRLAESFQPQIVLLDLGLPEINGYEVAQRIRAEAWGRSMQLIALTGWGQQEDIRRSAEAGFDHHLVKPIDPVALQQLIQSVNVDRAD